MTNTLSKTFVLIALACAGSLACAADLVCGMVCADNTPGSSCMTSCDQMNQNSNSSNGARRAPGYGAIALSPSTLEYGYSYEFPSRRQAEDSALKYCVSNKGKPRDCRVVLWYYDACASLAIKPQSGSKAPDGAWGAHWSNSRAGARKKALAACQSVTKAGCKTELTVCSGN